MKLSSMGRSNVRTVCGGVDRVGAVIGETVTGEVLSWPMPAKESRLERGCGSMSSPSSSLRSWAIACVDSLSSRLRHERAQRRSSDLRAAELQHSDCCNRRVCREPF